MHSIPQDSDFVQAMLVECPQAFNYYTQTTYLNQRQIEALTLYHQGLNVFPQPHARKGGYPWQRLQFTRLDRDHNVYGLVALFDFRVNMAVMCGRSSGNLFVLDCETHDSFERNITAMQQRGIPVWAVTTARGGHIYLRSTTGEVANVYAGVLPDMEVKGNRGYVLGPTSVHPTGLIYQWHMKEGDNLPEVDITAIDWLTNRKGKPYTLKLQRSNSSGKGSNLSQHDRSYYLSRSTQDYLNSGHTIPEGNRNNRLFSAACDLYGNGYTHAEATALLTPIAHSSGLSNNEIRHSIGSAYNKPRDPARPQDNHTNKKRGTWQRAYDFLHTHTWKGR